MALNPVLDASVKAYCLAQPMSGTAFGVAVPEAGVKNIALPVGVSSFNMFQPRIVEGI